MQDLQSVPDLGGSGGTPLQHRHVLHSKTETGIQDQVSGSKLLGRTAMELAPMDQGVQWTLKMMKIPTGDTPDASSKVGKSSRLHLFSIGGAGRGICERE